MKESTAFALKTTEPVEPDQLRTKTFGCPQIIGFLDKMDLPQWSLDLTIPLKGVLLSFTEVQSALNKLLASMLTKIQRSLHTTTRMKCGKTTFGTGGSIVWLSPMDTPLSYIQKTDLLELQQLSVAQHQESTTNPSAMYSLGLPAIHWLSSVTQRFLQHRPTGVQLLPLDQLILMCPTAFQRAVLSKIIRPQFIPWTSRWTQDYLTDQSVLEVALKIPQSPPSLQTRSRPTQETSRRTLNWVVTKVKKAKVSVSGNSMSLAVTTNQLFSLCTLCAAMVRITWLLQTALGTSVTHLILSALYAYPNGMRS